MTLVLTLCALINLFLASFMMGLIWLVQQVHYPAFHFVDKEHFHSFTSFHSRSITLIVLPVMLLELATSVLLWWFFKIPLLLIALILNGGLFALTFFVSVPCHQRLERGKNGQVINRLIVSNWPRTLLWSLRAMIMMWFLWSRFLVPN